MKSMFGGGSGRRIGASARAVASFIPQITEKAFEKHGFAAASLIMDWAQIVGADIASCTLPERLKWPRATDTCAEGDARGRPGATLVIRVDAARALDLEYRRQQLMERINGYFGYQAVTVLRFVQDATWDATPTGTPAVKTEDHHQRQAASPAADRLAAIGDSDLRDALERLSRSVQSGKRAMA